MTLIGFVQTLTQKGMPLAAQPKEFGNLFVEYSVVFPSSTSFTAEQAKKLKEILGEIPASSAADGTATSSSDSDKDEL